MTRACDLDLLQFSRQLFTFLAAVAAAVAQFALVCGRHPHQACASSSSSRTRCGAPTKRVRRVLAPLQALRGRAERGTGTVGTLLSIQARSTSWAPRSSHARTAGDVSRGATERPAARAGILGNIDARGPRTRGSRGPRRAARLRLLRHSRGDGVRTARAPSTRVTKRNTSYTPRQRRHD